jgi:hypothetical protein
MDSELLVFLFSGATLLFLILACAKDTEGKTYGIKRMGLIWIAALPYFLSSAIEFSVKHVDGSTDSVKITHSAWFLLIMPIAMIRYNILRRKKSKKSTANEIQHGG